MSTNQDMPTVSDEQGPPSGHGLPVEDVSPGAPHLGLTDERDTPGEDFRSVTDPNNEKIRSTDGSLPPQPPKPRRPTRHAHFRHSTQVVSALHDEWEEYVHPNGSLYWVCSTDSVRVVSDIQPPLSKIEPGALSVISHLMIALSDIPQIDDYQNWEIYTDGLTCIHIHHGSRSASEAAQSFKEFKQQISGLQDNLEITTKLRLETAYWAYMQAHPNHKDLPEGALDDATEALVWCHADRVLFRTSNAPFSKEDAQDMTDLIKTISDLKRPTLKTWYCAAVLRAISENRLASHYGRNDAREVRRRERSEDLSVTVPFNSWLDSTMWYLVGLLCLGPPFGYLKRINNVDRTTMGDGINTLRWRAFLKLLCKDWQDSNLLATVLVSATVALLAVPGINGLAQIAGIISALCAVSSAMCGMLLISNHQDHLESAGGAGILYFKEAKRRGTGTTRPLAVILGLPASLMLWGMFWFIFSVISYSFSDDVIGISGHYSLATRILALAILGILVLAGTIVLAFFYDLWNTQALGTPTSAHTHISPTSTATSMVNKQGGNPLMELSGNQPLQQPKIISRPHSKNKPDPKDYCLPHIRYHSHAMGIVVRNLSAEDITTSRRHPGWEDALLVEAGEAAGGKVDGSEERDNKGDEAHD